MNTRYAQATAKLVNKRFGRWTVTGQAESIKGKPGSRWNCVCECGTERIVTNKLLVSGQSNSCGCLHKERVSELTAERLKKHGMTVGRPSRVYRIWTNMMSRCYNENFDSYPHYGGNGIKVADSWHTFQNFFDDMGCPQDGMSLDRIDGRLDYEKGNCRWATKIEQARNTKSNRLLTIEGKSMSVAAWAEQPNAVPAKTIYDRLASGWESQRAVFQPKRVA